MTTQKTTIRPIAASFKANHRTELRFTPAEPETAGPDLKATCDLCGRAGHVAKLLTNKRLCMDDLAFAVSTAATVWPDDVRYSHNFERRLNS